MKWYRINIDFLYYPTNEKALETSMYAGKDKEKAIELYEKEIGKNQHCVDDKTKAAKIELVKYIYNKKLDRSKSIVLCKNY